jgi:DNA-binding transcriptional MocR family regulator
MTTARELAWLRRVARASGPIYLAVADALADAIAAGELSPGDRLPPQRRLAEALGVDLTTVTRALATATQRGLVEGAVGRGTFVRARAVDDDVGLVDLSMNLPPPPEGLSLADLLRETTAEVLRRTDTAALMTYHADLGTVALKTAGAGWLEPCLGEVAPARVLVTPGSQAALAALLSALTKPGDRLVVEPLTYPGIKGLATQFGLELIACPVDEEGVLIEALDEICRTGAPAALYLVPTMQNPTTTTMSLSRRRAVAGLAVRRGLWVIEDDPYSLLLEQPPPALASLSPQRVFHVATLSKCLSPGLRLAFLVCPPGEVADRVAEALRALVLMPAPLMSAVVSSWIRDGLATELLAGVRREAVERREIAARLLPRAKGPPESLHVWLDLPPSWSAERLYAAAQTQGVAVVAAETFATGVGQGAGARLSLGGPIRRAVLTRALTAIAGLVAG